MAQRAHLDVGPAHDHHARLHGHGDANRHGQVAAQLIALQPVFGAKVDIGARSKRLAANSTRLCVLAVKVLPVRVSELFAPAT